MDQPTSTVARGVSITVNGPATFYFGKDSAVATPAKQGADTSPKPPTAVEKKLRFDPDYDHRPGFKTDFLAVAVPLPGISANRAAEILESNGTPLLLKYHHYSVVMNKRRRLQMWSAVNVDYTESKRRKARGEFGTDTWTPDPRIAANLQIEDAELYDPAKKFDRGHIVRRDDTAWGDTAEEEILANSDSFHWTNCTPQHEQFNRAVFQYHGLWGELENHIAGEATNVGNRLSVLGGPILDDQNDIEHDFGAGVVKVPRRFWKIVLVAEDAETNPKLRAYGFVLDQSAAIDQYGLEKFSPGDFDIYQKSLQDITTATGVTFHQTVMAADAMQAAPDEAKRKKIRALTDIRI